jgi:hypothetical protein
VLGGQGIFLAGSKMDASLHGVEQAFMPAVELLKKSALAAEVRGGAGAKWMHPYTGWSRHQMDVSLHGVEQGIHACGQAAEEIGFQPLR